MSDQQSVTSSSINPGDSVSSRGGKKPKPGKAERAAKRAAQGGVPGMPASASKAAAFASGAPIDPTPQPGRFPVVFQTGAGEPTRDLEFCYDLESTGIWLSRVRDRYVKNPRYNEFKAHSGLTDANFGAYTSTAFLLSLAQQTVHSHLNMGLPLLDFGPVSNTEVEIPLALKSMVQQYGEFAVPSLGSRFLLAGYEDTVSRLVYAAQRVYNGDPVGEVLERAWLPMNNRDRVTRVEIADVLNDFLSNISISVSPTVLEEAVLSGDVPDAWNAIKGALGDEPEEGEIDQRDRFDFLFKAYADVGQFTVAFTTVAANAVLEELSLSWRTPQAGHLNWNFVPKRTFAELSDRWARVAKAYGQYFHLGAVILDRSSASGSQAQFVEVETVSEVTVIKTHTALSAPQFSLAACFPPECIFLEHFPRNVVLTTALSVAQRATDFLLGDWK